jgi:hypothetical protein
MTAILQDAIKQIEAEAAHDPVERPLHYCEGAIECIDAIEAVIADMQGTEAFLTGQVLKYLWRWDRKGNPTEDLRKAQWYLRRLLSHVESQSAKECAGDY